MASAFEGAQTGYKVVPEGCNDSRSEVAQKLTGGFHSFQVHLHRPLRGDFYVHKVKCVIGRV